MRHQAVQGKGAGYKRQERAQALRSAQEHL